MTIKQHIHNIIFESDTKAGKAFDVLLFIFILFSTIVVMVDSVPYYHDKYGGLLTAMEWTITIFFTIEYILRIYSVNHKMRYITSFFGIVDILSILPTYLGLLIGGSSSLSIIRVFRLLRVFRIFNLGEYMQGGLTIYTALRESRKKIVFFLFFLVLVVFVFGGVMYVVESGHPESGFANIPLSVYWAIVTITTVGYGDISPVTPLGQFLASIVMILGYAVIAVPTGIVSAEIVKVKEKNLDFTQHCQNCGKDDHLKDAAFCSKCGESLGRYD